MTSGTTSAQLLAAVLTDPQRARVLTLDQWTAMLCVAHAERLSGSLAARLSGMAVPDGVASHFTSAIAAANAARTQALWESEMARRALRSLHVPVILLKGAAFVAAGLAAGQGRLIGDLDILVPRVRLAEIEAALLAHGWEWAKPNPYDDAYYRQFMHELPPLIHRERDTMIDVHHTLLPLTARITPDADALIADAVPLRDGLSILMPEDMLLHAVAHLFADGDLAGGLRNLWDIDQLIREHADVAEYWPRLARRASLHGLTGHLARALRLTHHIFETPVPGPWAQRLRGADRLYVRRLLARNSWGQETGCILRQAFYIRSHWLRMPPLPLARHLWIKWRRS